MPSFPPPPFHALPRTPSTPPRLLLDYPDTKHSGGTRQESPWYLEGWAAPEWPQDQPDTRHSDGIRQGSRWYLEGPSRPQTTAQPARYQALWRDTARITTVSGGSGSLLDCHRTAEISSTLVGHGKNHDGIWRVRVANFEEILAAQKITFQDSSQEPFRG